MNPKPRSLDGDAVRGFLRDLIWDAFKAAGVEEDCSFLLCNVTTGTRELMFLKDHNIRDENGLRTKAALATARASDPNLRAKYDEAVLRPNADAAADYARRARNTLADSKVASVVVNPAVIDVYELGLKHGLEVTFGREDYLSINRRLLREFAKRVFVCPEAEFGAALAGDFSDAAQQGIDLRDLDGSKIDEHTVRQLVHDAGQWMLQQGFTEQEVEHYIGPSALADV